MLIVVSALYMLLMEHFETFVQRVQSCVGDAINVYKTFNEAGALVHKALGGSQVFGALTTVVYQYVPECDYPARYSPIWHLDASPASRTRPRSIRRCAPSCTN